MEQRYRAIRVQIPFCIREHEHTVMCQGDRFPAHNLKIQPETKRQVYSAWLDTLHDCHLLRTGKTLLTTSYAENVESLTGEGISQEQSGDGDP